MFFFSETSFTIMLDKCEFESVYKNELPFPKHASRCPENRKTFSRTARWRRYVNLAEGLEYDYFVEVDRKDWEEFVVKPRVRIKKTDLGIFFNPDDASNKKRIEFRELHVDLYPCFGEDEAAVTLHWDEANSTLIATRRCDCPVYYFSHLNDGEKQLMEKDKKVVIYDFEKLCQQLADGQSETIFDPRKTMLRFGEKYRTGATEVLLRSRTAGGLYKTFN